MVKLKSIDIGIQVFYSRLNVTLSVVSSKWLGGSDKLVGTMTKCIVLREILNDADRLLSSFEGGYDDVTQYQLLFHVFSEPAVREDGSIRLKIKEEGICADFTFSEDGEFLAGKGHQKSSGILSEKLV